MKNNFFLLCYLKNNPQSYRSMHNFKKDNLFLTIFLIYKLENRDNFITFLLIQEIKFISNVIKRFYETNEALHCQQQFTMHLFP